MEIILTCGCLSRRGLHMLGEEGKNTYILYARKIKEMKDEGLLEEIKVLSKREGYHKTIRLANIRPTNENYVKDFGINIGHYYRYGINNARAISFTKKAAGIKAYRESEIVCMLSQTDIRIFPNEKVRVREDEKIPLYPPAFYNSLEIKDGAGYKLRIGDEEKEDVVGSRIIGVITSEGGIYSVYHTEDKQIRWTKNTEGQMSNSITRFTNERCVNISDEEKEQIKAGRITKQEIKERKERGWEDIPYTPITKISDAILVGVGDEIFLKTMNNSSDGRLNLYESGYKSIYSIPYTKDGQKLIQLMTEENWKEKMLEVYLEDFSTNTKNSSIDCDGVSEEDCVLLFCIPDLIKLKKYINGASYMGDEKNYIIYCFDFQEEFIKRVTDGMAEIRVVEFSEYWEYVNGEEDE